MIETKCGKVVYFKFWTFKIENAPSFSNTGDVPVMSARKHDGASTLKSMILAYNKKTQESQYFDSNIIEFY